MHYTIAHFVPLVNLQQQLEQQLNPLALLAIRVI
jgi:hypothetical protein